MRRHPRATARRRGGDLAGPVREVVYILERRGVRGGAVWLLVLSCGHPAARRRSDPQSWSAIAQAMLRPLEERLAPRRAQCHHCGAGEPARDPAILVWALGGEMRLDPGATASPAAPALGAAARATGRRPARRPRGGP